MMNNKIIGVFHSEEEVIRKVDELEAQGYKNSDICAVAKNEDDISLLRGKADIDVKTARTGWFDRFVSAMTGDQPVREALHGAGITGAEVDRYYRQIEEENGILLYVDQPQAGLGNVNDETAIARPNVDEELHTGADVVAHSEQPATGNFQPQGRMDDRIGDCEEERIRLHKEKLNVDKEEVSAGEVNVEKNVVEDRQSIEIPVSKERVEIERRPVDEDQAMNEASAAFDESEEQIRIPLREEHVEVTKKPVVNEEIVIRKKEVTDTETVDETLLREEADIDVPDGAYGEAGRRQASASYMENTGLRDGFEEGMAEPGYRHRADADLAGSSQDMKSNFNSEGNAMNSYDKEEGIKDKLDEELAKRRAELQRGKDNPFGRNSDTF